MKPNETSDVAESAVWENCARSIPVCTAFNATMAALQSLRDYCHRRNVIPGVKSISLSVSIKCISLSLSELLFTEFVHI